MDTKKMLIQRIIAALERDYPDAKTELVFDTPHQLLVATILSAQCTDKRVNLVTEKLFKKYKSVSDFANAAQEELEMDIHSTGFYRNKAKNVIAASKMIEEKYGGKMPDTMGELITFPGVARKTANVVLSEAFGKQEGVAVDTHVIRLANLLGLTASKDAKAIERDLMAATGRKNWGKLSNLLILHGRNVCSSRNPGCKSCSLKELCPSARIK